MTVDEVAAEVTYALRRAVLRPDGGEITWAGDEDPATFHLAARTPTARSSASSASPPRLPVAAGRAAPWQLRGMATDPAVRGAGAGRALLADGLTRVAARGGDLVWCDARVTAAGFYERMGFTVGHRARSTSPASARTSAWSIERAAPVSGRSARSS